MKSTIPKLLNTAAIIFLLYFTIFMIDYEQLKEAFKNVDGTYIFPLIILNIFIYTTNGYVINKVTLGRFGVSLSFKEWFGLSVVNTAANLVFPLKTGTLLKAAYLKKNYNFDISHSAGILVFSSIISLLTILITACLIFAFLEKTREANQLTPWLSILPEYFLLILFITTLLLSFFGCGMIFYLSRKKIINPNSKATKIEEFFISFQKSIIQLNNSKKLTISIILNSFLILCANIATIYFGFIAIGVNIDILSLTCINLLNTASFYISATPGNFGFQELIISLSSIAIGVSIEQGLAVAIIVRATSTALTLMLGSYYYVRLSFHRITS